MSDEVTGERLARIEAKLETHGELLADIKSTLAQILSVLMKLSGEVAEIRGRQHDAPTARDFGRLEGRVDALEAWQPVTLAYQQPGTAGGG